MKKKNCWEFKKCGREPNGSKVDELGICPSSLEKALDGLHDGKNAGRTCWVVGGTLCQGKVQGTFAQKFKNCVECGFYKTVKEEEGAGMEMSIVMLNILREAKTASIERPTKTSNEGDTLTSKAYSLRS